MTSEQFTYWLQGKLEGRKIEDLALNELKSIQDHLNTVFHKVTPEYIHPLDKHPRYNPANDPYFPPSFPPGQVIC